MIKCKLCGKKYKKLHYLSIHINKSHKEITKQQYYDKYINPSENKMCLICGKKKKIKGLSYGYYKTCGNKKCSIQQTHFVRKYFIGKDGLTGNERADITRKQTNLKKYGVEYTFQNENIKKKFMNERFEDIDKNGLNSFQRAQNKIKKR